MSDANCKAFEAELEKLKTQEDHTETDFQQVLRKPKKSLILPAKKA